MLGIPLGRGPSDVIPNYHLVLIRASALLLPMWPGEARGYAAQPPAMRSEAASSILADYHAGLAAHGNQIDQFACYSFATDRDIRNCCQTLACHIFDHVEYSEPATTL
jgi:hypothetical protein